MAFDEFINSVRNEVAKRFDLKTDAEIDAFFIGIEESAKDNQEALEKRDKMLRDTVAELCEAKRLLKATTSDIHDMLTERFGVICEFCKWYDSKNADCAKPRNGSGAWCCEYGCSRYADEVKELIGETNDKP